MKKLVSLLIFAALAVAAVGGVASAQDDTIEVRFLTVQQEDEGYTGIIAMLAEECQADNPNIEYKYEYIEPGTLAQRIQLLAGANDLPLLYASPALDVELQLLENGQLMEVSQLFDELGISNELTAAGASLQDRITGGNGVLGLPLELNIEGFWYNKQHFADYGLDIPTTWDDLIAAAEIFDENGIQPFAASGEQMWPLTRLINAYVVRYYGADTMERIASGELQFTDEGFVEAASVVKSFGDNGWFGLGVNTVDYATAIDQFLFGDAAMLYMGSWTIRDFIDPERNLIGAENIGLFNIPLIEGHDEGSLDAWSMNSGQTVSIGQRVYDEHPEEVGKWLTCVFSEYGDLALSEQGVISGFSVDHAPDNIPSLTLMTQETIGTVETAFLWFEALFSQELTDVAWANVQLLVTGDMSAEEYMSELQRVAGK